VAVRVRPGRQGGSATASRAGTVRIRASSDLAQFLQSGATYWVAMLVVGVLNLGFNVVALRLLHPVRYGELAALISLVNLVLIASGAVSRTVTAVVATLEERHLAAWFRGSASPALAGMGLAATLVVGLFAGPIAGLLHLSHPLWVWIAAFSLVPGYAGAVVTGVLQGLRLFREAGAINLLAAVLKFATLLLLLGLGLGVTGGTLATLTEVTVVWVASYIVLAWPLRGVAARAVPWMARHRDLLGLPVALTVARLLYFNVDILMARHYLGPRQAGLFAALGLTGRIIAYGTGALPPVIYPYLIRFRGDRRLTVRTLGLTLLATAIAGGGAMGLFFVAPHLLVHLFGADTAAIAPFVGWYALAFLFYSLAYVLLYFLLAAQSWWVWVYAIGGSALEILGLMLFHRDIAQFTVVVTVFFGLMFVLTGVHTVRLLASGRRQAPPADTGAASSMA
jgi:O-antigen/teichoic acid export membrane protein